MINVSVEKQVNENSTNLVRRFTKRVRESGVLPRVRSIRYKTRKMSKFHVKKGALKSLHKRAKREELIKLGKITEHSFRFRRR